eukprot:4815186-Pleurochrysis_carterae.AAC.4
MEVVFSIFSCPPVKLARASFPKHSTAPRKVRRCLTDRRGAGRAPQGCVELVQLLGRRDHGVVCGRSGGDCLVGHERDGVEVPRLVDAELLERRHAQLVEQQLQPVDQLHIGARVRVVGRSEAHRARALGVARRRARDRERRHLRE